MGYVVIDGKKTYIPSAKVEDQEPVAIVYTLDIMEALKAKGYTPKRLREECIFPESAIQQFRHPEKGLVSWRIMERLCFLLDCEPGDLIKLDKEQAEKNAKARAERTAVTFAERKAREEAEQ